MLGRGGFFGLGESLVPVPWKEITTSSPKEITMNVTAQELKGAPKLQGNYANLNRAFLAKVRQYYAAAPAATGASQTPGASQQGAGQSQSSTSSK